MTETWELHAGVSAAAAASGLRDLADRIELGEMALTSVGIEHQHSGWCVVDLRVEGKAEHRDTPFEQPLALTKL